MLIDEINKRNKKKKQVTILGLVFAIVLTTIILNIYLPQNKNKLKADVNANNNVTRKVKISIMGDSISTFKGYIPTGFAAYYPKANDNTIMDSATKTWWHKLITDLDFELGGNSSWSGSKIACDPNPYSCFSSTITDTASISRIDAVGINGQPDYILIYGGTNDTPTNKWNKGNFNDTTDTATFIGSYYTLISRLKSKYPNAELIAIIPTRMPTISDTQWNEVYTTLKTILENNKIPYVDLSQTVLQRNAGDHNPRKQICDDYYLNTEADANCVHPNEAGMEVTKNEVKKELNKRVIVFYHKNDGSGTNTKQHFKIGNNNHFGYNSDGTLTWGNSGQFGKWDREGYELLGWNTDPNATTAKWDPYNEVWDSWIQSHTPSIDLYAIWKPREITVKYNKNDGSGTVASQTFKGGIQNQKFGYENGQPKWEILGQFGKWDREGYELLGWSTDENSKIKLYDVYYDEITDQWITDIHKNEAGTTPNQTLNLYAVWEQREITVKYNKNDGSGAVASQIFKGGVQNQKFGYENGQLKWGNSGQFGKWDREGYKLLGWSTDENSKIKLYDVYYEEISEQWITDIYRNTSQTTPNKTINLYAIWEKQIDIPTCSSKTYNGQEQILFEEHTNGGYTNSILKGTNAGNYTVTLTLTDDNQWSDGTTTDKTIVCTINSYDISNSSIENIQDQTYNGSAITPLPVVTLLGKTLIKDDDYTLSYSNNINVGTANITITGKGNYVGVMSSTFEINKAVVDIPTCSSKTYNGHEQILFESHNNQYTNNELSGTNVGNYIVHVTPTSNYKWNDDTTEEKSVTCTINPYDITNASVVPISPYTYDGDAKEPIPSVLVNNESLTSTDYDVAYTNNINAGTASLTITGKGNYTGTVNPSPTFEINKTDGYLTFDDTEENVEYSTTSHEFNILTHSGDLSVSDDNATATVTLTDNKVTIGNINTLPVGTTIKVTVTSAATTNYKQVTKDFTLKITSSPIIGGSVKIVGNNIVGSTLTAQVTDTEPVGTYAYQWYKDGEPINGATSSTYTVTASDAGSAIKVVVTATKANYEGTSFEDSTDVTNNKTEKVKEGVTKPTNVICNSRIYTASSQTLATIPTTDSLKYGLLNNSGINAGNYTVTARLNDGYIWSNGDTVDVTFTCSIEKYNIVNTQIEDIEDQVYTGSEIKPEIVVTANDKMLHKDIDYIISYSNNINVGTATITITGKDNFIGTKEIPFNIVRKSIQIPTCAEKIYNGQEQILFERHTSGNYINAELKETNAGNYNVELKLANNYQWSDKTIENKILTCKINPYNISNSSIENIQDQTYTGSEIKPLPIVMALNKTLINETDYTLEYSNNINVGTASITIVGVGNYTGAKVTLFKIVEAPVPDMSKLNIKEDIYVILDKNSTKKTITDIIGNVSILRNETELESDDKLFTGDIIEIGNTDYEIAILGDANKDGKVNISDLTRTYKIYKRTYTPSRVEWYASNSNGDENINISDLTRTYKIYKNN